MRQARVLGALHLAITLLHSNGCCAEAGGPPSHMGCTATLKHGQARSSITVLKAALRTAARLADVKAGAWITTSASCAKIEASAGATLV